MLNKTIPEKMGKSWPISRTYPSHLNTGLTFKYSANLLSANYMTIGRIILFKNSNENPNLAFIKDIRVHKIALYFCISTDMFEFHTLVFHSKFPDLGYNIKVERVLPIIFLQTQTVTRILVYDFASHSSL